MPESPSPSKTGTAKQRRVCYIPEQLDKEALTSPPTSRDTPLALVSRDVRTLFSVIYLLPKLFLPLSTGKPSDELNFQGKTAINLTALITVTVVEVVLFILMGVSLLSLPGLLNIPVSLLILGTIWLMCVPLRGSSMIVYSSPEGDHIPKTEKQGNERWVFVNGVLQSHYNLKQNCDHIAHIFGRPIIGIHNPTYGLIGDLLECIFQRSFSFNDESVRFTYDKVKEYLINPSIEKVVLMGHSQGGIVVSMALDLLFVDLPAENIAKLEVYTFGSAASHFNNPLRAIDPLSNKARPVISYIEHYVNSEDMVTRWGVVYNVEKTIENKFAGKVFIRMNAPGHMLNQHYLDQMFLLPKNPQGSEDTGFLDEVVEIDETVSEARDQFVHEKSNDSDKANRRRISINKDMNRSVLGATKTVRELSRLWRYMGGNNPDDFGQSGNHSVKTSQ
ncbi:hypothetical protein LOZ53_001353 [Ophidiomyces ophidiicola]|nr:hypothetical protein LOZ53_001353 [Ophidiomyces ophidiicola]